jgi:hypothetical protein
MQVNELLPAHLKYFIEPTLVSNLNKTLVIILGTILNKYFEKLYVIHLIIAKWQARTLHNQLMSLYKN